MLIREWLRLLAVDGIDPVAEGARVRRASAWPRGVLRRLDSLRPARRREEDFAHEVKEALDGCLACNACAGQCPVKVSIPTFRAKFFELCCSQYLRPPRDYLVGALESLMPRIAQVPRLYNFMVGNPLGRFAVARVGMVDTPRLSGIDIGRELKRRGVAWARPGTLARLDDAARRKSVVIVQDAFISYFETRLVLDLVDLLTALGFRPFVAPYRPGGTPLHVLGFLGKFEKVARRNAKRLQALQRTGVDLVGIDPAMTLPYRGEYRNVLQDGAPKVKLLQEWLSSRLDDLPQYEAAGEAHLMPHCSESATAKASLSDWTAVFKRFGLKLEVVPVGCCGMAGNYGHEAEHAALSRTIYDGSWGKQVVADKPNLMATGFSCRAQAERFSGGKLPHPVQTLLATVGAHGARGSGHR